MKVAFNDHSWMLKRRTGDQDRQFEPQTLRYSGELLLAIFSLVVEVTKIIINNT